ncbi:unnamed protein product, partial [Prorocentrum cordatum]
MAAAGCTAAPLAAEQPRHAAAELPVGAAARAAGAGRLQAALTRVADLEAQCARLQADLDPALVASQAMVAAAAHAVAQGADGVVASPEGSGVMDGKRDPLLRADVPEVVARLALVAPVMAADLFNELAATLDVGRRNVVCHHPAVSAAEEVAVLVFCIVLLLLSYALLVLAAPSDWAIVQARRGRSAPPGAVFALAERARRATAPKLSSLASGARWWKWSAEARSEAGDASSDAPLGAQVGEEGGAAASADARPPDPAPVVLLGVQVGSLPQELECTVNPSSSPPASELMHEVAPDAQPNGQSSREPSGGVLPDADRPLAAAE